MYEFVRKEKLDEILQQTFAVELISHGFEQITPRKWVRSEKQNIRDLFVINLLKGAQLSPCWGISIDYVRHISGSTLKWHRTPKSAILDLRYDPIDYVPLDSWTIPTLDGLQPAIEAAQRICRAAMKAALPWYDSVKDDLGLIAEFERKKHRPAIRFGFDNYVQEPLAYLCVLARAGKSQAAENELNSLIERDDLDASIVVKIRKYMAESAKMMAE